MIQASKNKFANHELVTIALFLLGGHAKPVDLEEIAMKVNRLAPGSFTWKRYPGQINIKNVDAFLWDAKKPKNGSYVINAKRDEWILTAEGLALAHSSAGAEVNRAISLKSFLIQIDESLQWLSQNQKRKQAISDRHFFRWFGTWIPLKSA